MVEGNAPFLLRENLSAAFIVLTTSHRISDLTMRDIFQLN